MSLRPGIDRTPSQNENKSQGTWELAKYSKVLGLQERDLSLVSTAHTKVKEGMVACTCKARIGEVEIGRSLGLAGLISEIWASDPSQRGLMAPEVDA